MTFQKANKLISCFKKLSQTCLKVCVCEGVFFMRVRSFSSKPSKYVRGSFYIIKGIKNGCEWRREKMLLFICIFGGHCSPSKNFLIYIESGCE
ncbi:hypothetical protein Hanom_Chr04g00362341 [Helianthus anomalus]